MMQFAYVFVRCPLGHVWVRKPMRGHARPRAARGGRLRARGSPGGCGRSREAVGLDRAEAALMPPDAHDAPDEPAGRYETNGNNGQNGHNGWHFNGQQKEILRSNCQQRCGSSGCCCFQQPSYSHLPNIITYGMIAAHMV